MLPSKVNTIFALICFGFLSACGGGSSSVGGNSSNTVFQFTSFDDLPDDGIVEIDGSAVVGLFATDLVVEETDVSNVNDDLPSIARITRQDGSSVKIELAAPGSQVAFDLRRDDDVVISGPLAFFFSPDGQRIAFLLEGNADSPYEHQILGTWLSGFSGGVGEVGAAAYGSATELSSMPAGQNATYDGLSTGIARRADGQLYSTISEVEVRTDFRTIAISSTETEGLNLTTGDIEDTPELDFRGGGTVTGNAFTSVVSGTATIGSAVGVFHGPNAEEVAGTYNLSGADGITHIGAFGAK